MKKIESKAELVEIDNMDRAIVFIQAKWSIYAVKAERLLRELEKDIDTTSCLFLYDVDDKNDYVATWLQNKLGSNEVNLVSGAGSTVWISNGVIHEFVLSTGELSYLSLKEKINEFISGA